MITNFKKLRAQGQEIRKTSVNDFILAITWVELTNKDISLLAVALSNGTVRFYHKGLIIEQLHFNSGIISMTCGRFGREDGVLIMISKGIHIYYYNYCGGKIISPATLLLLQMET